MEKNKVISAEISHLISLISILDEYEKFRSRLIKFTSSKYNSDDVRVLSKISKGEFVLGRRKAKKFYKENKDVIDKINARSRISSFIFFNYGFQGNVGEEVDLDFFYHYFMDHKNELEQISSVLARLKMLGFTKIQFDPDADFTHEEYTAFMIFNRNIKLTCLANMQVVPNYRSDFVKYRTTRSPYRIEAKTLMTGQISAYGNTILLNSLSFDPSCLPETISKETIFDVLIAAKEEKKADCTTIIDSVDLSVSIDDLQAQFNSTFRIIERLNSVKTKEELRKVLASIQGHIDQLRIMSVQHDASITGENSTVTKENLKGEKLAYLKRREAANLDFD